MSDSIDKRPGGRGSAPGGGAAHDPAGAILIRLETRGGRVAAVDLASSRPTDFSHRLFAGRPVDHLLSTLPMVFFSKVRLGVSPEINALATILVAIVAVGTIIAGVVMARQRRRRELDMRLAAADR